MQNAVNITTFLVISPIPKSNRTTANSNTNAYSSDADR